MTFMEDRDAFTHEEQEGLKEQLSSIQATLTTLEKD